MYNFKNIILFFLTLSFCLNQDIENDLGEDLSINNAIEKYQSLSKNNPDLKEIDFNLGNLNYYKGEYDKAINYYNEALKTKDILLKSNTHFNLGNTFYSLNDYERSLIEYRKSLETNPNNEEARYNYELLSKIIQENQQKQQSDNQEQQDSEEQGDQEQQSEGQEQQDSEEQGDQEQQSAGQDQKDSEEQGDQEQQNEGQESNLSSEEKLEKEEAEAILNSLKANHKNLMKRKYKPLKSKKVVKDW